MNDMKESWLNTVTLMKIGQALGVHYTHGEGLTSYKERIGQRITELDRQTAWCFELKTLKEVDYCE